MTMNVGISDCQHFFFSDNGKLFIFYYQALFEQNNKFFFLSLLIITRCDIYKQKRGSTNHHSQLSFLSVLSLAVCFGFRKNHHQFSPMHDTPFSLICN